MDERVKCLACGITFRNSAMWAGHKLRCNGPPLAPRYFVPLDKVIECIEFENLLTDGDDERAHGMGTRTNDGK